MYDIPFDRSFLQLSNGIRHVMPSSETKPELTTKASMAQPVSQLAVYANGLTERKSSSVNVWVGGESIKFVRLRKASFTQNIWEPLL
jgi:hypothetical protein